MQGPSLAAQAILVDDRKSGENVIVHRCLVKAEVKFVLKHQYTA